MAVIAVDIGGTKVASGIFARDGSVSARRTARIAESTAAGDLVIAEIASLLHNAVETPEAIGICVPGIYYADRGTVWAPNITGWTDYPLVERVAAATSGRIPVRVDSDRACYVLGEEWQGRARGCRSVIFLAVGTGIGVGILVDGHVLRGVGDAAGAIGWMALDRPYREVYNDCGCFEYNASGAGIAKVARERLARNPTGALAGYPADEITASLVLDAERAGDPLAGQVVADCVELWGMATANLVSLFNPEMIVFGGGVFESAARLLPVIREEARRWAQPISIDQVTIEVSQLGADAGLIGAARLALQSLIT